MQLAVSRALLRTDGVACASRRRAILGSATMNWTDGVVSRHQGRIGFKPPWEAGRACYDARMVVTVLAIGDIIGRPGREAVAKLLPQLRREFAIDLVVANGENAAGGFGLTPKIADDLFSLGIDVLTSGNHIWDQREMMNGFEDHRPIRRPHT